ncbi:MAG: helix-hairpin-helix domain-containing protein [Cycloclasticus sp.]|nr:helix-hairpin-helix domain-containing protein [Cycloclasticus sp.]MBQ0789427.1 helix-hairpin-helix domain-containing protein [Cycloclasticus sp.]
MKIIKSWLFVCSWFFYSMSVLAVNVNTAPAEEISKQLNGVGAAKAEAIVTYRTQNGAFKTLEDLSKVKGIGAATLDKNRENIEFDVKP